MDTAKTSAAAPENFILRIYRRDPGSARDIAGTVEVVATGMAHGFNSLRELQQILGVPERRGPVPAKEGNR
ncbi:MAG: hypothetical protein Q7T55_12090 [Solirubrobacteraceae bacterium]|nr:hypothetical protein [Solirubrobacteraceae bacterium]